MTPTVRVACGTADRMQRSPNDEGVAAMLREGPQVSRTDTVVKRRLRVRMTYSGLLRCVACGAGTAEYAKDRSDACRTQARQMKEIEMSLRVHAGGSYV